MDDENLTRADTAAGFEDLATAKLENSAGHDLVQTALEAHIYATLALGQRVAELTERLDKRFNYLQSGH